MSRNKSPAIRMTSPHFASPSVLWDSGLAGSKNAMRFVFGSKLEPPLARRTMTHSRPFRAGSKCSWRRRRVSLSAGIASSGFPFAVGNRLRIKLFESYSSDSAKPAFFASAMTSLTKSSISNGSFRIDYEDDEYSQPRRRPCEGGRTIWRRQAA